MPVLRELTERSELGLEVLTGHDQLEREVRWVHITELPDPSPYLRERELVLTNGLPLRGGGAARYVRRLLDRDVSGLVYGRLAESPDVPPRLVAACRRGELPLLALPVDVPFTAVSEAMAALQAEERQRDLVAAVGRGDALTRVVAEGAGPGGVLALLASDQGLPVALVDWDGHILAAEGVAAESLDGPALARALHGPARAEVRWGDERTASVFPVGVLGEPEAVLVCLRPLVDISRAERSALEQAARFLTVELTRRRAIQAIESRFAGELLEMLYDDARRGHELPGRLRSFGIDPDGPLAALSVAFAQDGRPVAGGLAEGVGRVLLRHGAPAAVTQGSEDAMALLGWPRSLEELRAMGQELTECLADDWPQRRLLVGIGTPGSGVAELRRSMLQAREARRALQRRRDGPAVASFDHVGSHRMLLAMHEEHVRADFAEAVLGPIRAHDRERAGDLEHTLRTWLEAGGRPGETAARLHVHVNTLRNRLARIEELTGRDLDATDDRVDLYLALQVD
jgi:purine catabolism regulator